MTMGQLKKWITDTLSADAGYSTLCVATVGSALNFYRSSPSNDVVEALPFFTVFTDESSHDFQMQSDFGETWNVPIALGIGAVEKPVLDGATKVWESTDNVEILAKGAIDLLRKEARTCGIYGEDVIILNTRVIVSEIGDADDVQANIFLVFGKQNNL